MLSAILLFAVACWATCRIAASALRAGVVRWTALVGGRTESDLASLFVFVPARRLIVSATALAVLAAAACVALDLPVPVLVPVVATSLIVPRSAVWWLRRRWRQGLARQLPDALTLWAGLLRAGQSTPQSLARVAQRQGAPLGDELRMIQAQMRLGIPMESAVAGLCDRAALPDLRLLATLLGAHRELGGNLAESLQRLAGLMRGRLLMEERIRSLTAQGRMQGVVVGVLPLLLLVALYTMEPDAMRVLHSTWQGWIALGTIAILELTGFLLIRRIVRIDV